jgi:hypothetical protein
MSNLKIRRQAIGLLVGYALQFMAGMVLNLFITLPKTHPGSTGPEYLSRSLHSLAWTLSGHGGWALAFHVYLGMVLILGSISLLISARLIHSRGWSWVGAITLLFTMGAFFNGLSFVDYNKNISSLIMASCWLISVWVVTFGMIKFPNKAPNPLMV